jgi:hypothetical protein
MYVSKRIKSILNNPYKVLRFILDKSTIINHSITDKTYLKIMYRAHFGKNLNLKNPQTYNQKLQWLKLYDRNPIYTTLVDKYLVKEYVKDLLGEEYIIPTLGVYDSFDEINFSELPDQFVLKTTHDSGGVVICENKESFDISVAKIKLDNCLKESFFYYGREWPYKNVKPRIIAEKYMVDESGYELKDYKFFCFDGVAKSMFIASDRGFEDIETKFDFYDMDFNHLSFTNGHPNSNNKIQKPKSLDKMKLLAERLSENLPHVRVDFYDINGRIYFGEMTFFHWSGFVPFEPEEWDYTFGSWIKLPNKKA